MCVCLGFVAFKRKVAFTSEKCNKKIDRLHVRLSRDAYELIPQFENVLSDMFWWYVSYNEIPGLYIC